MQNQQSSSTSHFTLVSSVFLPSEHNRPTCSQSNNISAFAEMQNTNWNNFKITYINDPKKVFPVRTAKQIALRITLWWCSQGSRILCSITPASIWYLLNKESQLSNAYFTSVQPCAFIIIPHCKKQSNVSFFLAITKQSDF